MKWIIFSGLLLLGSAAISCNQNSTGSATGDTTVKRVVPPASDNSQATNPSLADTSYPKKDSMVTPGDSARSKK
ncbi:MAG TPA: hypothetical protein VGM24_10180 [Puia sp.]|jgi:hypothetical protein